MTNKILTRAIQPIAEKYRNQFTFYEKENGQGCWVKESLFCLGDLDGDLDKLIIRVFKKIRFNNNYAYQFIVDALDAILGHDDIDDIQLEADVMNSDLLTWADKTGSFDYIDEAVGQFGYTTFYKALCDGQLLERTEVFDIVVDHLHSLLS